MLEHGLLEAAQDLDDIHRIIKQGRPDGGDDNEDDEANRDETVEEFGIRVQLFVAAHLYHASSSKRDDYKVGLCYQSVMHYNWNPGLCE